MINQQPSDDRAVVDSRCAILSNSCQKYVYSQARTEPNPFMYTTCDPDVSGVAQCNDCRMTSVAAHYFDRRSLCPGPNVFPPAGNISEAPTSWSSSAPFAIQLESSRYPPIFTSLTVRDFSLSWSPSLILFFATFVTDSDESRWDHVDDELVPLILQLTYHLSAHSSFTFQ